MKLVEPTEAPVEKPAKDVFDPKTYPSRATDGPNALASQVGPDNRLAAFLRWSISHNSVWRLYDAVAGDGFVENVLNLGKLVLPGLVRVRTERPIRRADVITTGQRATAPSSAGPPVLSPAPSSRQT